MTRHRFLLNADAAPADDLVVGSKTALSDRRMLKQIRRVLRLRPGDTVDLLDGRGNLYTARLEILEDDRLEASIIQTKSEPTRKRPNVEVVMPVLKGDRFDWAIEKLTEIGVDIIQPVFAERSVARGKRPDRWMSISKEATEQCERFRPPEIREPKPLEEIFMSYQKDRLSRRSYICSERSESPHLVRLLCDASDNIASSTVSTSNISVFIGPEGGFSDTERKRAEISGISSCSLGNTILRAETAAVLAAGILVSVSEFIWST